MSTTNPQFPAVGGEFALRPIQPADDPAVAQVIRTVMPQFGAVGEGFAIVDPEVNAMSVVYRQPRHAYFVLLRHGKVVGGGGIAPLQGGEPDVCELRKMYFLEDVRGKGWGKTLMEECLAAARRLGFKRVYLETLNSMSTAQKLYEKTGFKKLAKPMGATGHFGCDRWYALDL